MTRERSRWLWPAVALALVAAQVPVLLRTAGDASQSDFANYFTPAFVLARGGDVAALYDRDTFDRALTATGIQGLGSFVPHPPANALWLLPFAGLPPHRAKVLWSAVLVLAIIGAVWGSHRLVGGSKGPPWLAVVLVLAPTLAIRNGLAFGQPYLILSTLLVLGTLALVRGRPLLGGVLLGLGVSFKPYALILGALFLGGRHRRALFGFALGAIGPSLLLVGLAGPDPFLAFADRVLPWMLRAEIQDPFSTGWGSGSALVNRLFRFEADLNPTPWIDAPALARCLGAALSAALLTLGVVAGRSAMARSAPAEAVGASVAWAIAASPFAASYHVVLLLVSILAVAPRLTQTGLVVWALCWAGVGSQAMYLFRSATGVLTPLAFIRFFALLGIAQFVSRQDLSRRRFGIALVVGALAGGVAVVRAPLVEHWTRVENAHGYAMFRPHFCGTALRWWSPSTDGRRLESRGDGAPCDSERNALSGGAGSEDAAVVSVFVDGSFDLYVRPRGGAETRLTHSGANEVDPVITPDGCHVVFASDQGRGLGSTALYRIDLSHVIDDCETLRPALNPR